VTVAVAVSGNSAVSWSLQVAFGNPVGTLSSQSGTSATYTAPASVASQTQVTVVATVGGNSAYLPVFVQPAPQVTGTSSSTAPICPALGSVVLPSASGALTVGQNLNQGQLDVLTSGGVAPFTWAVQSGALPAGISISPETNTAKVSLVGTPVTPGCFSFTMQATDATGTTATSKTLNLVVIPAALKVSAPNIGDAFVDSTNVGVPYPPGTFVATGGIPPYTWSLPGAGGSTALPPGLSLSSGGLLSGVPSSAGLLQNGGFGSYSATLLVNDSQSPYPATAQPTASITVFNTNTSCGTGSESVLTSQGPYAFLLRGFDATGPVTISGNFTVNGAGAITAGVEDITRSTGVQTNLSILPGSTYTVGRDNRGCVTLTNSAGTTTVFRIAMGGCSTGRNSQGTGCQTPQGGGSFYLTTGRIAEFDDSTGSGSRVSGIIRLQNTSIFQNSGISGQYAFGLSGSDSAGGRFAMAGSATAGAGTWSSVAADTNNGGTLGSSLTGGSGTFSIGANGRGTGTLVVGSLSLNLVLYPVSSSELMLATASPLTAGNPVLSGEAISTTGPFSFQSLQNTHMFHISGPSPSGSDVSVGIFAFDGIGGVTGTEYENQAGTLSVTALSGQITPLDASTGRFSFFAGTNQNMGIHPLVGYVIPPPNSLTAASCNTPSACVTGFLISTDSSAQAGVLDLQTSANQPPPPFTTSAILGKYDYGTDEDIDSKTANFVGTASANPAFSALSFTQDSSYADPQFCLEPSCVLLISNANVAGSYAVNKDGSGRFGGQTASVTNGAVTFFIDESPLNSHPAIMVAEQ
jgi:large repetitive protein